MNINDYLYKNLPVTEIDYVAGDPKIIKSQESKKLDVSIYADDESVIRDISETDFTNNPLLKSKVVVLSFPLEE